MKGFAVLILCVALASCGPHVIHVGAYNSTDSVAYDALIAAQAAIDQARVSYANGTIPPATKDALNNLIKAYDVARASWLTYRGALVSKEDPTAYLNLLNQNLTQLSLALQQFKGAK